MKKRISASHLIDAIKRNARDFDPQETANTLHALARLQCMNREIFDTLVLKLVDFDSILQVHQLGMLDAYLRIKHFSTLSPEIKRKIKIELENELSLSIRWNS